MAAHSFPKFLNSLDEKKTTMNNHNEFKYRRHKWGNGADLIVLMKAGDFYETYDEDAKKCAKVLDLTLSERKDGELTGFPKCKLQEYVLRLVKAGYQVVTSDGNEDNNYTKENLNQYFNNYQTTSNMEKKFRTISAGVRYMFNKEMQSLVEVKPMCEVFNLNNGKASQVWRVANTDKTVKTRYEPATEEEPEKFDGVMYKTFEDFEKGRKMTIDELFYQKDIEGRICSCLLKTGDRHIKMDEKGAYYWTIEKGQAVKWYFIDHIDTVTWEYNEKGQITVTSDCECELPEAYRDSEDVYKYNDYRFVDAEGQETVREGVYKRLYLDADQVKLAEKLQKVLDECKAANMCIYWSNADYTLNAVNVRHVERIEHDPDVDEEKEEAHWFDDSRVAHVFKNVTDYNSEDTSVKFVVKKS